MNPERPLACVDRARNIPSSHKFVTNANVRVDRGAGYGDGELIAAATSSAQPSDTNAANDTAVTTVS